MNAPVSRRALLGATAALGALGLPISAVALAHPRDADAELFALLDRWREAQEAWNATEAPSAAALARARAAYPPIPEALYWRPGDFPRTSYGRAASDAVKDTDLRAYGLRGVEFLRRLRTAAQWDEAAEARRQEVVGAHEDWMEARRAVEDATGYAAESQTTQAAAAALSRTEEAVKLCQARTIVGLAHKAAWVAGLLAREAAGDDLAEVFARQVAAFGGLTS